MGIPTDHVIPWWNGALGDITSAMSVSWKPCLIPTHWQSYCHQDCVGLLLPADRESNTWWRHQMEPFSALLAHCAGNSPVPVTRSFDVLICAWINDWVNNGEAGDLRRHRGDYDVIIMPILHIMAICPHKGTLMQEAHAPYNGDISDISVWRNDNLFQWCINDFSMLIMYLNRPPPE